MAKKGRAETKPSVMLFHQCDTGASQAESNQAMEQFSCQAFRTSVLVAFCKTGLLVKVVVTYLLGTEGLIVIHHLVA